MLILSVCILAACDNSSQPVVSGTGTGTETETPPVTPPADTSVVGNTVPDGAFFACWNGSSYATVLKGGDEFPAVNNEKDVYLYKDYIYRFGKDFDYADVNDGWGVSALSNEVLAEFGIDPGLFPGLVSKDRNAITAVSGPVCESINGKSVKSMAAMFMNCSGLVSIPGDFDVPDEVTNLKSMFFMCSALTAVPYNFVIPEGARNLGGMFRYCTNLASLPIGFSVPAGVTNLNCTFAQCTALDDCVIVIEIENSSTVITTSCFEGSGAGDGAIELLGYGSNVPLLEELIATGPTGYVVLWTP